MAVGIAHRSVLSPPNVPLAAPTPSLQAAARGPGFLLLLPASAPRPKWDLGPCSHSHWPLEGRDSGSELACVPIP